MTIKARVYWIAGPEQSETFKTMEQRLLRYIMTPAMAATWIFGISLVLDEKTALIGFCGAPWTVATYICTRSRTKARSPVQSSPTASTPVAST